MAMVLGSLFRGEGAARAASGFHSAMFVMLRPLLRAVLLSHAARTSYSGMRRVSVSAEGRPIPGPRCWVMVGLAGVGSVTLLPVVV